MKRSLTLLLASLLLVFSLTACGGDEKQQDTNQNGSAVTNSDNANGNKNDTDDRSDNGTNGNGNGTGSLAQDAGDAVTDGIDDVKDGIDDVGDALTGDNVQNSTTSKTRNTTGGATYGQMLRNGRVHDQDGNLTDGENSVTRGAMF